MNNFNQLCRLQKRLYLIQSNKKKNNNKYIQYNKLNKDSELYK
jgi:hypothetical protein